MRLPKLVSTPTEVLLVDVQGLGVSPAHSITAYRSGWVMVTYENKTTVWFRADQIARIIVKDRAQHELELEKLEARENEALS